MRIYYQYSTVKTFPRPDAPHWRGDLVNEIGLLQAMSKFAEVYYSGIRFRPDRLDWGLRRYQGPVESKLPGQYDIHFIRNSPRAFDRAKGGLRLIVASPYDEARFRAADAVVTYTETWANGLRTGSGIPPSLNPHGKKFKNVLVVRQVAEDRFMPLQDHKKTKQLRREIGGDFIVGIFGRIVKSNRPDALFKILPDLVRARRGLRVAVGITKGDLGKPKLGTCANHVVFRKFPHATMPFVLSACDLLLVSYRGALWAIAGSMKSVEATCCGTPILMVQSPARAEVVGANGQPELLRSVILKAMDDREWLQSISQRLAERGCLFRVSGAAPRLQKKFQKLLQEKASG